MAGFVYDELDPVEPAADHLQRGFGDESFDRPDRELLFVRDRSRTSDKDIL